MSRQSLSQYGPSAAILLVLAGMPLITREPYVFHILCLIGINVIFACSLNAILNIGELNLAQAAFMGIGAYASTLLVVRLGISFWIALPAAALITVVFSLPIGFLTLRFKGAYFLFFTFLFAELVRILLSNFWIRSFWRNSGPDKYTHAPDTTWKPAAGDVPFQGLVLLSRPISHASDYPRSAED